MTSIITTTNLSKSFTSFGTKDGKKLPERTRVTAVDQVSFELQPGDAVGYIGANGAGKSTTIKMLLGILKPSSGSVETFGMEPMKNRKAIARRTGVVFGQRSQLWWDLPVKESFRILAAIHRLNSADSKPRIEQLREALDIGDFWDSPVRKLSLGQRMRAEIAAALVHRPELLVLDEPTIGLDVLSKQQLRDFLNEERQQSGTTLLLTTHDLGDIQQLCDRVLLVDQGSLAFDGTLATLSETTGARRILRVDYNQPGVDVTGIPHTTVELASPDSPRVEVSFTDKTTAGAVTQELFNRGDVKDLAIMEPDIEDVVRQVYQK